MWPLLRVRGQDRGSLRWASHLTPFHTRMMTLVEVKATQMHPILTLARPTGPLQKVTSVLCAPAVHAVHAVCLGLRTPVGIMQLVAQNELTPLALPNSGEVGVLSGFSACCY